jgi:uncharacterized OB-fold protein
LETRACKSDNTKGNRRFVGEELFTIPSSPSEKPRLIGSKCNNCGAVVFPKQSGCPNCCSEDVKQILLSPTGKLASFTNVNHSVPAGYKGPVPYGVGWVDLPEGVRVTAHLTEYDPDKLRIGADMIMIMDRLFGDAEGNEVIGFKFKPV